MSTYDAEYMLRTAPSEWRRVPGYTNYVVNRCGDVVSEFGRMEAAKLGGHRSYRLHAKFRPDLVCTPSDLILRAFSDVLVEEAREHDLFPDIVATKVEKPAVSDEAKSDLADMFQRESGTSWWEVIHDDKERALILVDYVIKAGWGPLK